MIKKEYKKPELTVVAIKTTGLMAASLVGNGISNIETTGDALSREGMFADDGAVWDFEDDEILTIE